MTEEFRNSESIDSTVDKDQVSPSNQARPPKFFDTPEQYLDVIIEPKVYNLYHNPANAVRIPISHYLQSFNIVSSGVIDDSLIQEEITLPIIETSEVYGSETRYTVSIRTFLSNVLMGVTVSRGLVNNLLSSLDQVRRGVAYISQEGDCVFTGSNPPMDVAPQTTSFCNFMIGYLTYWYDNHMTVEQIDQLQSAIHDTVFDNEYKILVNTTPLLVGDEEYHPDLSTFNYWVSNADVVGGILGRYSNAAPYDVLKACLVGYFLANGMRMVSLASDQESDVHVRSQTLWPSSDEVVEYQGSNFSGRHREQGQHALQLLTILACVLSVDECLVEGGIE